MNDLNGSNREPKDPPAQRARRGREPPAQPAEAVSGPAEAVLRPAQDQPSVLKELLYLLLKIGGICLAFLLAFTFIFGLYRNTDPDMVPALRDGDLVFFYRLDKRYVAGDTLVLEYQQKRQVRRVVATAGDTVDITENGLIINSGFQQEPDIYFPTHRYEAGIDFPVTLKEGQVFVLGDYRPNATDSRIYGVVETRDTLGKVMALLRRRHL